MRYRDIPRPRHKKGTSKRRRRDLQRKLELQWRHWTGPGAVNAPGYMTWIKRPSLER